MFVTEVIFGSAKYLKADIIDLLTKCICTINMLTTDYDVCDTVQYFWRIGAVFVCAIK